jgi:hypothetical protein
MKLAKNTKRFLKFHRANPNVYDLFCKITFQAMQKGLQNFGVGAVFEIMRWETGVVKETSSQTLCNTYRAYYARLFELHHPTYTGYFRSKSSSADELIDLHETLTSKTLKKNEQQLKFTY